MTDELPFVHKTVVHMLARAGELSGGAPALTCGDRTLNYREFVRCVAGFATELRGLGSSGDRVALVCGNSIEMAIATFAVHAAGFQAVPVNPIYTERELAHILSDSDPVAVVFDDDVGERVVSVATGLGISHQIALGGDRGRLLGGWRDDDDITLPAPLPEPDDLATLQYTGGTTGLPKGANITHGQLSTNISQREAAWPTIPDDEVILCVMPLFHVFASSTCLHLSVYCRGKLVILPRYHPETVLDAIERDRITRLPVGPTIYHGLMAFDGFGATDFSSLRTGYSGSAPLPEETLRQWQAQTGCPILEGYGQTEAGPVLTGNFENGPIVAGSVGIPLPRTEIQIVDTESGTEILDTGQEGEIRARGPQIMSGYRNRPEETAEALRDGWLYTGDIGRIDADGIIFITDRKKDMAIVGGYNVYPREIDEVLYSHPNVLEAAAVGVPDSYRGEIINAFVVLKNGSECSADDLADFCRRHLAKYKVPGAFHMVDELPKTTVGKIDKAAMRKSLGA